LNIILKIRARVLVIFAVLFWVVLFWPDLFFKNLYGSVAQARYPQSFLWGAAYSAHQTEGVFGGGENGDWWAFEHSKEGDVSPIVNGDTADVAVDHWHRYSEDYKWAKKLGLNSLRTSLAWEKIEPAPGVFSEEVLSHYRAQFQRMKELGIRPMIALHHFTHPLWFNNLGGWLSPESSSFFLRYAEKVVQSLGDLCDLWITFNEPMVLVMMGYLKGDIPPQVMTVVDTFEATYNLARAHRRVVAMIHEKQGQSPKGRGEEGAPRGVGLANSFHLYDPFNPRDQRDVQAAQTVAEINNWAFLRAIEGDRLKFEIPYSIPGLPPLERVFPVEDIPVWQLGPMMDWVGVNYYSRYLIRYVEKNFLKIDWIFPKGPQGDNGWAIQPQGLEQILRQTALRFKYPLFVTENGLADSNDLQRPQFIRDHLLYLDRALFGKREQPSLDLIGYYHWSLMDNFEWLHGYKFRFGLLEIQYDQSLKRVPRKSAWVYKSEIEKRQ
jgi:beta-glucosidase